MATAKASLLRRPYVGGTIDWLQTLALGLGAPLLLETYWTPRVRSVDLADPAVGHPLLPDIIPSYLAVVLSFAAPLLVYIFTELSIDRRGRTLARSLPPWTLGLAEANGVTILVTTVLKLLVGRPRPHFAAVCGSYVADAANLCSGSAAAVAEARKSFPSGHASLTFAAAVYTSAYLLAALSPPAGGYSSLADESAEGAAVRGQGPKAWRVVVVVLPPTLAALVAASRTIDYHHNYGDVVAGAVIGTSIAVVVAWNRGADITNARQAATVAALPTLPTLLETAI
jgi:diacylglycerol diphosphate phosphatase / phosphatidate phosphatase